MADPSIIPVPRLCNNREENEAVKRGETPADWEEKPAKNRQKGKDAAAIDARRHPRRRRNRRKRLHITNVWSKSRVVLDQRSDLMMRLASETILWLSERERPAMTRISN
jgi:hypothetical protein